jgi:hypothetical protein
MLTLLVIGFYYPVILIVFFGLVLLSDWLVFLDSQPGRQGWLAKASHGVGVTICGAYILRVCTIPSGYVTASYCVYGCLVLLGIFWLCIGAARAQIHHDMHLLIRAAVKFGVGFAVVYVWQQYRLEIWWPYRGWIDQITFIIALWCWVTGVTKIIICLHPMPRLAVAGTRDPYGDAGFRRGDGLQGRDRRYQRRRT